MRNTAVPNTSLPENDPELAVVRQRHGYAAKGFSRAWIDQRMRCISSRHEIVSEWHSRGVSAGEDFRLLTNRLMAAAFGMEVTEMLQRKGLPPNRNLRDHLSNLELALISLAESTAASLHRHRASVGIEKLGRDIDEVGRLISQTRAQIEAMTASIPAGGASAA